jgi:hypothetical protein
MKRRDLILSSAGVLVPALGRAVQPCPPPQVGVSGGTSATTTCPVVSSGGYSTSFNLTENPISEGGKWTNGSIGIDWKPVQTTGYGAFPGAFESGAGANDCIAHLNPAIVPFNADQYAEGTVYRPNPASQSEVELLLRFSITPHNARGYEVYWSTNGGLYIVRWNGPYFDFSYVVNTYLGAANHGDKLRAQIKGSVISVYLNGNPTAILTGNDTSWKSGQPGVGFTCAPGGVLTNYGWRDWKAGNL